MPASAPRPDEHKVDMSNLPRVAEGWERIFPVFIKRTDTGWQVQVYWWRLMASVTLLLCALWVTGATGAYLFVKYQRGFDEVHYTDMLFLPARWETYQQSRGDFLIRNAQFEVAHGKFREAYLDLSIGVSKSPGNAQGLLLLAKFLTAWHRPDRAEKILLDGLPYRRNDFEYIKEMFTFLIEQQRDTVVIAVAKDLLGKDRAITQLNQLIALSYTTAAYFRGNYDQAEDLMRKFQLDHTREGQLLTVRIEWERGYHDEALARLRELQKELPKDDDVYAQIITYLRECGRESDARRESLFRQLSYPEDPKPRIDLLYAYTKDGDEAAVKSGVESILHDFAKDEHTLFALADFAANNGQPDLARRIYDQCKANNLNWEGPALMMVEAEVVAKRYQEALILVKQLMEENPAWAKRYYAVFNGLQAIASYGKGSPEDGMLFLSNFMGQPSLRADNLIAVSNRLVGVGARIEAQQALAKALKTDPLNQAALTSLVKIDVELGDADALGTDIHRLIQMRKPDRTVVESAYRKLGSDLFLFHPDRTALLQEVHAALEAVAKHS